jgi:hypothetical protein
VSIKTREGDERRVGGDEMLISSILGVVAGSTIVGVEARCGIGLANSALILDKTSESMPGGESGTG